MSAMMECIELSQDAGVLTIAMNRPPVNALGMALARELTDALEQADADEAVKVVVLRAHGKGFCAGADLREAREMTSELSVQRHAVTGRMFTTLYNCRAPVVAAMHGFAIGAGLGLAALADIRIATEETVVSMPEVRWAISVGGGGSKLRRLGLSAGRLRELMLTGDQIRVSEPRAAGIVDYVVSADALEAELADVTGRMARHDRLALRAVKEAMNVAEAQEDWAAAYEATHSISAELVDKADVAGVIDEFFGGGSRR